MKKKALTEEFSKVKLEEIRRFCRENSDPARVQKYARYFVEGYDAYGVDAKLMEKQRDLWLEEHQKDWGLEGFLHLGDLLVKNGKYEEASFAIWFALAFSEEFTPKTLNRFAGWLDDGFRNWAHTDVLCGQILSPFLLRKIVTLEAFSSWRGASSKWRRRAAAVALIEPAKKRVLPVKKVLDFVGPMMDDREKVVQQGLGWLVREVWKLEPAPAEKFLLQWKETCGRLIIQYATEKMTKEQKARFKRKTTKTS